MNIETLKNRLRDICLTHADVRSFHIGNTWDEAVNKSDDRYPAVWFELPVLIDYTPKTKTYTISMNILELPKLDDVGDELHQISHAEEIADALIQAFSHKICDINVGVVNALSLKNVNSDIACGVRLDLAINTSRLCDYDNKFNNPLIRE